MLSKSIEKLLNEQAMLEQEASQYYLSMASWAEVKGYKGISEFLFRQSDEERQHMLKLFHYINDRGGHARVPCPEPPPISFENVNEVFEHVLEHEKRVTAEINNLVDACLKEKDYTTHNFMQWYVAEQIEEENTARNILDKLKLIGNDKGGMYLFDRDMGAMQGGDR
jgi:ferritin